MVEAFAVLGLLFAGLLVGGQNSTDEQDSIDEAADNTDRNSSLDLDTDFERAQNEIEVADSLDINFVRVGVTDFIAYTNDTGVQEGDPTSVVGSAENDVIRVNGTGFEVVGGGGADLIHVENAGKTLVWADFDDTVLGSNLEGDHDVSVLVSNSGIFYGGNSSELGIAIGSSGSLYGGGGDDTLESFEGESHLFGGDGDDFIISDQTNASFSGSASVSIGDKSDHHADSIFGGGGNDTIELSRLDVASGGIGLDTFIVRDGIFEGDGARITDFDKICDIVLIQLGGSMSVLDEGSCRDLLESISVEEIDGSTVIMNHGEVVTFLEGVTGVSVGIALPETELGHKFMSLDGIILPASSFNVLVVN